MDKLLFDSFILYKEFCMYLFVNNYEYVYFKYVFEEGCEVKVWLMLKVGCILFIGYSGFIDWLDRVGDIVFVLVEFV